MGVEKQCSRTHPHEPHEWIGRRGLRADCPGVLLELTSSEYARQGTLTFGGTHLPNEWVMVDVEGCARCGLNHDQVTFRPFDQPMFVGHGKAFSHWGSCPSTGEPILLGQMRPEVNF